MDPADIRAFAGRDWAAAEASKRAYLAERAREGDGMWAFWAAQALFEHMRALRPDFPTEADHAGDLEHHVALKRTLDRASRALLAR